jgi:hypothetical protein
MIRAATVRETRLADGLAVTLAFRDARVGRAVLGERGHGRGGRNETERERCNEQ